MLFSIMKHSPCPLFSPRVYKSRHFEYIKSDTFASDEWPGKLRHFGVCCGWEIIDIISTDETKVKMLDESQEEYLTMTLILSLT